MLGRISIIQTISRTFLTPISRNCGLFVAIVMLCSVCPVIFAIGNSQRILTFISYAIAEGVVFAYAICLAVVPIKSRLALRWVRALILILFSLWGILEVGTIVTTGEPVSVESVSLMLQTDIHEAMGFMRQYFSFKVILACGVAAAIITVLSLCSERILRVMKNLKFKSWLLAPMAVSMICVMIYGGKQIVRIGSVIGVKSLPELLVWEGDGPSNVNLMRAIQVKVCSPVPKAIYIVKSLRIQMWQLQLWKEYQENNMDVECIPSAEKREFNIVIIIGESFIRSHSSLYGYYLPTNPVLEQERQAGRLIVFSDMLTAANYTTTSIRNMLNLNDLSGVNGGGEKWYEGLYFPFLVRKSGWKVYHYDNQAINESDLGIGSFMFSDFNMKHTYDGVSDVKFRYDGDYVSYVKSVFGSGNNPGEKSMVIYHLMGQHFMARDRYPGNGKFTADDIIVDRPWLNYERKQEVAEYDNATLYNDSVVGQILDMWTDVPTVALYFSDHGEDMWDLAPMEARNKQNPDDEQWLDRQYHIPFMMWLSDGFSDTYPELDMAIRNAVERPGMLDNLGQMVLGLCGSTTPCYRPERDLLNPSYEERPRRTSEGYLYDK